jgi:MOSC domain-containing protein YiiM
MQISQLRVGLPQEVETKSGNIFTALMKSEVLGPTRVTPEGIEGDGYGSPEVHGNSQQIVCAYPEKHYDYWKNYLQLPFGAFGENIILTDCDEHTVRIGDICKIGDVVLELTYPRQPCATLNKVWDNNEIMKRIAQTGKTGWFYKVIRGGTIQKGMTVAHTRKDELSPTVFEDWMRKIKK